MEKFQQQEKRNLGYPPLKALKIDQTKATTYVCFWL